MYRLESKQPIPFRPAPRLGGLNDRDSRTDEARGNHMSFVSISIVIPSNMRSDGIYWDLIYTKNHGH